MQFINSNGFLILSVGLLLLFIIFIIITIQNRKLGRKMDGYIIQQQEIKVEQNNIKDDLLEYQNRVYIDLLNNINKIDDNMVQNFNSTMQTQIQNFANIRNDNIESKKEQTSNLQQQYIVVQDNLGKMEKQLNDTKTLMEQKLFQNEERMNKMRISVEDSLKNIQHENSEKLEKIRLTVDEKLNETLNRRLSENFAMVNERLEQVYKGLGEMKVLTNGVEDLRKVLSNVKTRGTWGEVQLGALLKQVLTEAQYKENIAVKPNSTERVEFAICLPNKDDITGNYLYLPIDSKFPQEKYAQLVSASEGKDERLVTDAEKALLQAVKVEAKRIASKYIQPPYTTDFAIMFLPTEALYAEVVRHVEISEQLQRESRIVLAGPTTLLALLNSLQMGFRTLAIEKRSQEIWNLLGLIKKDFASFGVALELTQTRILQASKSIDGAFTKSRKIQKKLDKVEVLEDDSDDNLDDYLEE